MALQGGAGVVDREKICPFLLRCFWKLEGHHSVLEYAQAPRGVFPPNEMQIYTCERLVLDRSKSRTPSNGRH